MTNQQRKFTEKVGVLAASDMCRSGILASLTIAQAILESGWGKSGLAVNGKALFGIKAGSGWMGKVYSSKTQECYDGASFTDVNAVFRAYDSWGDSVADHSKLFNTLQRYENLRGLKDYKLACKYVREDGYATDPQYTDKLIQIIEAYKLTEYESLFERNNTMPYKNHVISTNNERLTSGFGMRTLNGVQEMHNGLDFTDAQRLELKQDVGILAFADGKVVEVINGQLVGWTVAISHEGKIFTRYQHMKNGSVQVKVGDTVKKGQRLGVMGSTGRSTGIHLHFGLKENSTYYNNGVWVDPTPYLNGEKYIRAAGNVGTVESVKPVETVLTLVAGNIVSIRNGAVYGGLSISRGKPVPASQLGDKRHTVSAIATHYGEREALLKEINSWVAVKFLNCIV